MKAFLTFASCVLLSFGARAVTGAHAWAAQLADAPAADAGLDDASLGALDLDAFLELTPKKYRALTGERLGVKGALALKAAQKHVRKNLKRGRDADIPKGLYVVMSIFWLGWLAMGLMDDFEGNNWWVSLILYVLCWLPGVIYSLVKMKDYY